MARQAAMDGELAQAMASYMAQQGLWPCNGRPFMPLLVTAVAHKVCHNSLDLQQGLIRLLVRYDSTSGSADCMW